jgi:hypothetical protein
LKVQTLPIEKDEENRFNKKYRAKLMLETHWKVNMYGASKPPATMGMLQLV